MMAEAMLEPAEYTIKDVSAHKNPDDMWIIINDEVFDVTKYLTDHPGGEEVFSEIAGADGTEAFENARHSDDALEIKNDLRIGRLKKTEEAKPAPKTVRLVKPAAPTPQSIKTWHGFTPSLIALSLGVGSSIACLGLWWKSDELDLAALSSLGGLTLEWSSLAVFTKRKGPGFASGVLLASAVFAIATGFAARRFISAMNFGNGARRYAAHLKIPRVAQPDVLQRLGWLDPGVFQKLLLVKKELLAEDAYRFVFALPTPDTVIGLPTGQHVSIRGLVDGKHVSRSYTPISNNADRGVLELIVRCYPNGLLTNRYLRQLEVGDEVEFRGPKGGIRYHREMCHNIGMVAGGTGITPMYQVIRAICEDLRDTTQISLIYANRTEKDILLREQLDSFARKYPSNFKIFYVLDQAPEGWQGGRGFVTREMMEERFAAPSPSTKVFLCGPPPMVESTKKSLATLGFQLPGATTKPGDDILCF